MRLFQTSLSGLNSVVPVIPTNYYVDETEWVIAVKGDQRVRVSRDLIEISLNNGVSYDYSYVGQEANQMVNAQILANGNVLFFRRYGNMYLCDSTITFFNEKVAYLSDGTTEWTTTTGEYKYPALSQAVFIDQTDLFVWGNYIIGADGQCAIFYTKDFGQNISVCLDARGMVNGPRHFHSTGYNPYEDKWIQFTGDEYEEEAWYEGDYNSSLDEWTWTRLHPPQYEYLNTNIKAVGVFFLQDKGETYMYWGADVEAGISQFYGVWRVKWTDRADITKFELVIDTKTFTSSSIVMDIAISKDNVIVALLRGTGGMYHIVLAEETFTTYPIPFETAEFVESTFPSGIGMQTTDGYFRLPTDYMRSLLGKVGFIKPTTELFKDYTSIKP